jgi:hypothetical protein
MHARAESIALPARILALIATLCLSACGSSVNSLSGVGGGPNFAVLGSLTTGYFRDSNVSGLAYTTATQSGTTDASGSFAYENGEVVTFYVGALTVGAVTGNEVVTPLDLAGNTVSTTSTPTTQNIARFLMLMDNDADPSNGIVISTAVQNIAKNWPVKIDFGGDLPTVLAGTTILSDLNGITGEHHVLPSATDAQSHLDTIMLCTYSGAFGGTYTGQIDSGTVGIAIDPLTGLASGYALGTDTSNAMVALTGSSPLRFDLTPLPTTVTQSGEAKFSFQFSDINDISGNWTEDTGNDAAGFGAARGGTDQKPEYRFTGTYRSNENPPSDAGVLAFGINPITDPDNISLDGQGYSVATQAVTQISGNVVGTGNSATISMQTDNNLQLQGSIDLDATSPTYLSFRGTYSNIASPINTAGSVGTFEGQGCTEY